ncbi:M28 family metallopeptidase [Candidatus Nitrosocosmicus arcticus]|uniref:Leucyl aminopeptidase n=1 Tax=Candidatus Nitrosocosmicus arcticus TaxID=2035267 RepID=A0A557SWR7_9ARCH|nr:M28 family metallopeptidase [Candidatus Nitrosocosmicus arcticus]TVP41045.1 Leucyl aminopeptidase [Candidatus Nitrosocosmicus arcticus]
MNIDKNETSIRSILEKVSTGSLKQYLNSLSDFHTRHSKSPLLNDAGNWIMNELRSFGYKDTFYHSFKSTIDNEEFELRNIVCKKKGVDEKLIMVCAHYDCIMDLKEDSVSRAPGANDNGSGVCAIIEIARVLANENLQHSIQFVFFSGEEQGLLGSKSYAKYIKENGMDLYRLVNLDMIGYPFFAPNTVIIERDNNTNVKHNQVGENDTESIKFGEMMKDMTSSVGLQFHLDSIYDSDYEPFEANGYVVIGAYDGSADSIKNPHYHSSSDLPENIDWDYLTSVTKLVLATILKIDSFNSH